jgi:hypothetical protein
VKKLFLVLLVLLAGISGLSAAPLRPGGGDDTPLVVIPQEGAAAFTAPGMPAPMRPAMIFVRAQDHEAAFTQAVDLIRLWSDQYRQGLLTQNEFKTLVAGRIMVMYMRGQAINDIQRIAALAPIGFPLLC